MCGRFYIETEDRIMRSIIEEAEKKSKVKTGEIFPSDKVPVLTSCGEILPMRWGFNRFDGKGIVINARSETAETKSMFRLPMQTGRCLIACSYYFEWKKRNTEKIKFKLLPVEHGFIWLAGVSRVSPKTNEKTFVILTRPASESINFIHDRMPVIFSERSQDEWLNTLNPSRLLESNAERNIQSLRLKAAVL